MRIRANSVLARLNEDQLNEIFDRIASGETYRQVQQSCVLSSAKCHRKKCIVKIATNRVSPTERTEWMKGVKSKSPGLLASLFAPTDEQNMWRVQNGGDPEAFARLVKRWQEPIHRLCARMT